MLLPPDDLELFYRIHASVMAFANDRWKFVAGKKGIQHYLELDTEGKFDVHEGFFAQREEILAAYLDENPEDFDDEVLAEIASWKDAVGGNFFLFRQLKKHAIFLRHEDETPVAYGVLGLTQPFTEILGQPLPALVTTRFLPFRGAIVTDGLLDSRPIYFGGNIRKSMNEDYKAAKAGRGIVTSLAKASPKKKKRTGPQRLAALVRSVRTKLDTAREMRERITRFEEETLPRLEGWIRERFGKEKDAITKLEDEVADLADRELELLREVSPLGADEMDEMEAMAEALFSGGRGTSADGESNPFGGAFPDGESGPPPFVLDLLFEEYLVEMRGDRIDAMSDEEYAEARATFDEAVGHAAEGRKGAFEKALLGVGADRSRENRNAVNKAFRRIARSLHPDRNADYDDEAKELWGELGRAKTALDLAWIERIELKWRVRQGDLFLVRDEKRLSRFRSEIDKEIEDLRDRLDDYADHPMWARDGEAPGAEDEEEIAAELQDRRDDLQRQKSELKRSIESLKREQAAIDRKTKRKKRVAGKKKAPGKKAAKKKVPGKRAAKKKVPARKGGAGKPAGKKSSGSGRSAAKAKRASGGAASDSADAERSSGAMQQEFDF